MVQRQRKFGQFLLMIGGLLLILFAVSYAANQINFWLFLAGALFAFFGIRLMVRNPGEPGPKAERFRMVRKLGSKRKKKEKAKKGAEEEADSGEN